MTIVVPEVVAPELFNGEAGHFIDVPDNAIRLEFQLTTAPREANINLYVRFGKTSNATRRTTSSPTTSLATRPAAKTSSLLPNPRRR